MTGSRFALHLECPFRVVQQDRIFVGSDDLLTPAARREEDGRGHNEDEWLAYDVGTGVLRSFLDRKAPLVVAVRTRPVGDLQIELEHGITIEVLPTSLKRRESWRFPERFAEHVTFPGRPRSGRP
ncbi:hypothetical protein [Kitasatospora sp. NPDC057223]|uniref:hypothetical protein n=1 Tax=Kitasatospora sp. NPDC057223 TaxID=3346055 RepID=UPI003633C823